VATFTVCGRFLLESVKDWFIGVDPLRTHVPSRVQHGTTWLLIRKLWVCVSFNINGKGYGYTYELLGARGPI
jgi:hypothetical protein